MKKKYLLLFTLMLSASALYAQNPDSVTIDDYYVDFAVPDITAFSILDINENDVVRPGNVKELAAGIQNYVTKNGDLKPGLAVEFAPYRLAARERKVLSRWRVAKSIKNLQLSLGTAQGDSTNLLAAWGLNWTLVDRTDPAEDPALRRTLALFLANCDSVEDQNAFANQRNRHLIDVNNFIILVGGGLSPLQRTSILSCFGGLYSDRLDRYNSISECIYSAALMDTVTTRLGPMGISLDTAQTATLNSLVIQNTKLTFMEWTRERQLEEAFSVRLKQEKERFIEENWNRLVIQVKGGGKYNSTQGNLKELSNINWRIFAGIAGRVPGFAKSTTRFAKNSQVVYQANYTNYKSDSLEWEFSTGARLLYGKSDKRLSAELFYSKASARDENVVRTEYIRYTIGGEIKLAEGFWLELAIGGQKFLEGDDVTRVVPKFGLKYAIQKKSRF